MESLRTASVLAAIGLVAIALARVPTTGAGSQTWSHQPNGTLVNTSTGLCLDDPAGGAAGTDLVADTCAATASQRWIT